MMHHFDPFYFSLKKPLSKNQMKQFLIPQEFLNPEETSTSKKVIPIPHHAKIRASSLHSQSQD